MSFHTHQHGLHIHLFAVFELRHVPEKTYKKKRDFHHPMVTLGHKISNKGQLFDL